MVYSFDIFDTCLTRLCGDSRNVFEILSKKIQKLLPTGTMNELLRQRFVADRISAGGKNLIEIYSNIEKHGLLFFPPDKMRDIELETESEMLVPILETLDFVNECRLQCKNIVFISDMYLPDDFLQSQLTKYGFWKDGDKLFVSDSVGAYKYDGSLFRYIHDITSLPYIGWHHYGDNEKSDVSEPKKLGIKAHLLRYNYLEYELDWINQVPKIGFPYFPILAGISRAIRLSSNSQSAQKDFVCDISAPLMSAWVTGVVDDAERKGIKRLYFCARDMHTHYLMAKKLCQIRNSPVQVRYLFISGPALYNSSNRLEYYIQEGVASHDCCAIVDSCTSGKTLRILNELLLKHGYEPVCGYFIAKMNIQEEQDVELQSYRDYVINSSLSSYLFVSSYLETTANQMSNRVMGMRIFFELLFSLNYHKKVYGYEKHQNVFRPLFFKDDSDEWFFSNMSLHDAKCSNDLMCCKYIDAMSLCHLDEIIDRILYEIAIPTLVKFISFPNKRYLEYLNGFIWYDQSFVDKVWRKKVWKRGSIFYTMPKFVNRLAVFAFQMPQFRHFVNRVYSLFKVS